MSKVVFVLGAGASVNFGFPTGKELSSDIAAALNFRYEASRPPVGDPHLVAQLSGAFGDLAFNAARRVVAGVSHFPSVDHYLHSCGDDPMVVKIGKIGIASAILQREKGSPLSLLGRVPVAEVKNTASSWLSCIFEFIAAGRRKSDLDRLFSEIAFINFNYDRCVEHFLHFKLQEAFALTMEQAAQVMASLPIIRPYGSVGALPWQVNGGKPTPFGDVEGTDYAHISEGLFTLTEQRREEEEQRAIYTLLRNARQTIFLGFGFHKQNMDLLKLPITTPEAMRPVLATGYGASPSDIDVFKQRLLETMRHPVSGGPKITLSDCDSTMREYGLSIWG